MLTAVCCHLDVHGDGGEDGRPGHRHLRHVTEADVGPAGGQVPRRGRGQPRSLDSQILSICYKYFAVTYLFWPLGQGPLAVWTLVQVPAKLVYVTLHRSIECRYCTVFHLTTRLYWIVQYPDKCANIRLVCELHIKVRQLYKWIAQAKGLGKVFKGVSYCYSPLLSLVQDSIHVFDNNQSDIFTEKRKLYECIWLIKCDNIYLIIQENS